MAILFIFQEIIENIFVKFCQNSARPV